MNNIIKFKSVAIYYIATSIWLFSTLIQAQSINDLGSWNSVGLNWKAGDKLAFQWNSQFRSANFYNQFYQIDAKLNVYYSLNHTITFVAGTGRYNVYSKGGDFVKPLVFKEMRIWEEIALEQHFSRIILENKYHLDQRFTSDGYKNRFKFRIGMTIPVTHSELLPKTFFINSYDDIFYVKTIEINRIYGGFGYRMNIGTVQAGWLHQVRYSSDTKQYLNILITSMIIEIRNKKS